MPPKIVVLGKTVTHCVICEKPIIVKKDVNITDVESDDDYVIKCVHGTCYRLQNKIKVLERELLDAEYEMFLLSGRHP